MILYHYTTISALLAILQPESLSFHCTRHDYLNDKQELTYCKDSFLNMLKDYEIENGIQGELKLADSIRVREYETETFGNPNYYILSLSQNKDSLPMWRMYGEECNGIAIGINIDERNAISTEDSLLISILSLISTEFSGFELNRIRYGIKQDFVSAKVNSMYMAIQQNRADINTIHKVYSGFIQDSAIYIKNPVFAYEKEWRLALTETDNKPKYKVRNNVIVPYVEISLNKNMLKEIVLGPSCEYELNNKSLKMLLNSRGYEHVKICKSDILYRR